MQSLCPHSNSKADHTTKLKVSQSGMYVSSASAEETTRPHGKVAGCIVLSQGGSKELEAIIQSSTP